MHQGPQLWVEFSCASSHSQITTQSLNVNYNFMASSSGLLLANSYVYANSYFLSVFFHMAWYLFSAQHAHLASLCICWHLLRLCPPSSQHSLCQAVSQNLFLPSYWPISFLLTMKVIHIYSVQRLFDSIVSCEHPHLAKLVYVLVFPLLEFPKS